MHYLLAGFVSGALSGAVMGLVSHALFRTKVFGSSLILIDGTFFCRSLKREETRRLVAGAGICIHVATSGIFGALYYPAAALFGLEPGAATSFPPIGVYVAVLWLSMLLIALPVAGAGLLGRKYGRLAWLEQLVLHGIFCVLYYYIYSRLLSHAGGTFP